MTTERLDAILDRLEALLEETDDPARRKDVREIQQLVIGVREDWNADPEADTGSDRERDSDPVPGADGEGGPADED